MLIYVRFGLFSRWKVRRSKQALVSPALGRKSLEHSLNGRLSNKNDSKFQKSQVFIL